MLWLNRLIPCLPLTACGLVAVLPSEVSGDSLDCFSDLSLSSFSSVFAVLSLVAVTDWSG